MFRFFILLFHLKQKHEEGQRLLHYLQQTNDELATWKIINTVNQETCGNEINVDNTEFSLEISDECCNV